MIKTYICPCCKNKQFKEYLNLHKMPITDFFYDKKIKKFNVNNLKFEICEKCCYIKQNTEVKKEYLKINRATTNQSPKYLDLIIDFIKKYKSDKNSLILEIGSNDGNFLDKLKQEEYKNIVGIEPSTFLSNLASSKGHKIINNYFTNEVVDKINQWNTKIDVIICRHTLEHVDNPYEFIKNIKESMSLDNTLLFIEVPDSNIIYEKNNFYEFWDEHISYFGAINLEFLLNQHGIYVTKIDKLKHLDSRNLLVWCELKETDKRNMNLENNEYTKWKYYINYFYKYKSLIRKNIKKHPKPRFAIGASHPQTNFINYLNIESDIDYLIDDDKYKIGKLPPINNKNIKIISTSEFKKLNVQGTLLLTGFGYLSWTNQLLKIAKNKNIKILELSKRRFDKS